MIQLPNHAIRRPTDSGERLYTVSDGAPAPTMEQWLRVLEAIPGRGSVAENDDCTTELVSYVNCPGPPPYVAIVRTCCDGLTEEECVERHAGKVAAACG